MIFIKLIVFIAFKQVKVSSYLYHKPSTFWTNIVTSQTLNYLPQLLIPYEDIFPEESTCIEASSSPALLAFYNFTNIEQVIASNDTTKIESFPTFVFPYVKAWDRFIRILRSAEIVGFTSLHYKWIISLTDEIDKPSAKLIETYYINKTTSFGPTNPLLFILQPNANQSKNTTSCLFTFNLLTARLKKQIKFFETECPTVGFNHPPIHSFFGSVMDVAGVAHSLYDYDTKMDVDEPNRTVFASGFAVEILRGLQFVLNFSVDPIRMTDWGSQNSTTGEWNGMVGAAIRGEIDLAISSTATRPQRYAVVDFNIHTHTLVLTAFFKRYDGYLLNSLLLPFQRSLWMVVAIWILCSRLIYILFHRILYTHSTQTVPCSLSEGGLLPWIVVPITNRGLPKAPTHIALRTLYFFELVVAVVLNTVYSGILISFLSIEYNPISTLEDLVKSGYDIELLDYSVTKQGLRDSKDSISRSLYLKSEQYEKHKKAKRNSESPMLEILKGQYAYLIHNLAGFREIDRYLHPLQACGVQYIPLKHEVLKQTSFLPKGSQLRKIIDFGLLKMMETGLTTSFKERHLSSMLMCAQSKELPPVDNQDLQMAFSMLIAVYILAPVICVIENIWFKIALEYITYNYE